VFTKLFNRLAQERAADRRVFQEALDSISRLAERQTELQIEQAKTMQGLLKMFDYPAAPDRWVVDENAEKLHEAEVNADFKQQLLDMTQVDML